MEEDCNFSIPGCWCVYHILKTFKNLSVNECELEGWDQAMVLPQLDSFEGRLGWSVQPYHPSHLVKSSKIKHKGLFRHSTKFD